MNTLDPNVNLVYHLIVILDSRSLVSGEMDIPIHQGKVFFGQRLVKGGFLDAVFEEVGAGDGGEDVQ